MIPERVRHGFGMDFAACRRDLRRVEVNV